MKDTQPLRTTDPTFGVRLGVLPFERSYWVVPGRLLAGAYPGSEQADEASEKLRRLLDVGVSHVIDLTECLEANYSGVPLANCTFVLSYLAGAEGIPVVCRRHPIKDLSVPSAATMKTILDEIDEAVQAGRTVFTHCWGGRGRCGTVVGCYLARHGLATGDEALAMIRYLRRTDPKADSESPETEAQKEFVRNWSAGE